MKDIAAILNYWTAQSFKKEFEVFIKNFTFILFYLFITLPFRNGYYFTLAANQNNSDIQLALGIFYANGELIQHNIQKSIHYISFAANNNEKISQLFFFFL